MNRVRSFAEHFDSFLLGLHRRMQQPLPGLAAHAVMAPVGRKLDSTYWNHIVHPKNKSSVLVLLYPYRHRLYTVLIQRAKGTDPHSGQIGFPGGKMEANEQEPQQTALREAKEELCLDHPQLTVIGSLTPLYIPVSDQVVYPVLAACAERPVLARHPAEVTAILRVDCANLHKPERQGVGLFRVTGGGRIEAPFFRMKHYRVWGATALILSELRQLLIDVSPHGQFGSVKMP